MYSSIRLFCNILLIRKFGSKIVLLPCHPFKGMSSLFGNVLLCLYSLILTQNLFSLLSFTNSFWFISSSFSDCLNCWVTFLFSFQHFQSFLLCICIFVCHRWFFIGVSSLLSPSRFWVSIHVLEFSQVSLLRCRFWFVWFLRLSFVYLKKGTASYSYTIIIISYSLHVFYSSVSRRSLESDGLQISSGF